MTIMTFNKLAVLSATSLLVATTAVAEEQSTPKAYVGLDYGMMSVEFDSTTSSFYEDSFKTISPYVGVNLTDNFAVEAGYLRSSTENKTVGSGSTELKFKGFYLDAVGKYDVTEKLTALGSVGVARLKAEVSATGSGGSLSADETETSLRFGAGAEYALTDNLNARGMVRYMDTGFSGVDNAMQYTVGVNYNF